MLKNRLTNLDLKTNIEIYSEDFSSDRDFYNKKLLNLASFNVINDITDSEIYEYKPNGANELNFNIFFSRYIQNNEIDEFKKYMELEFDSYYTNVKKGLGLLNENNIPIIPPFNSVFNIRQPNGLRERLLNIQKNQTNISRVVDLPYSISDIIGNSVLKYPVNSGVPVFYNSYTLPFWESKTKWIKDDLLFTNKSYLYNSFLIMEIYDSPSSLNQNRIQSMAVFVNNRVNITEKNRTFSFHYERPTFNITEGTDGFSFFFLNNYITNEFYVKYSFWDALNGKKIQLLPSSDINGNKKWVQNPNNFDQNSRYVKYILNYDDKTYKIYEYNTQTKKYNIERFNFDLYELKFDDFYSNNIVLNEPPIDSKTLKQKPKLDLPIKFSIENLITNNFITSKPIKTLTDAQISFKPSFLNTKDYIKIYNDYLLGLKSKVFGDIESTEIKIPVINKTIKGVDIPIKTFSYENLDNKQWFIRSVDFTNITMSIDDNPLVNYVNNNLVSEWNKKPNYLISECIGILDGSIGLIPKLTPVVPDVPFVPDKPYVGFAQNVLKFYLNNNNIFKFIEDEIGKDKKIKEKLDQLKKNKIFDYENEDFLSLKKKSIKEFNNVKDLILSYLKNNSNSKSTTDFLNRIKKIVNPVDNQSLINDYIDLITYDFNSDQINLITNKINKEFVNFALLSESKNTDEVNFRENTLLLTATIDSGREILPNTINNIEIKLTIGEGVRYLLNTSSLIKINGGLRISINNKNEVKNIVIPIKTKITPGI